MTDTVPPDGQRTGAGDAPGQIGRTAHMKVMIRAMGAAFVAVFAILSTATLVYAAYPPVGVPGAPVVRLGDTETFSWTGVEANTGYDGIVHSVPLQLGITTSDASGNLKVTFPTASLGVGDHTITETAPDGSTVTGSFQVAAAATATPPAFSSGPSGSSSGPSGSSSGALAFTGAKVGGLIGVALLLFVVGFVALRTGRQRRSAQR